MQPGERVWVGIRHFHTLEHPGLHFLLLTDGSPQAQATLALGGQLARLANPRGGVGLWPGGRGHATPLAAGQGDAGQRLRPRWMFGPPPTHQHAVQQEADASPTI